uniref:Cullin N-terminal domain-containing protein n=1 Tax=Strigamia maritima TaxID=126957 RepID=T1ISH3_STRMM
MEEPMEEVMARNDDSGGNWNDSRTEQESFSTVMINMAKEDYEVHYWPKLEAAIHQLLTYSPGEYVPISYEQMYSCVYKCVCKQFSERLYTDLNKQIENHLRLVSQELQNADGTAYIPKFTAAMTQYTQALGGIIPIFNYMNRFYVENKLHSDLKVELLRVFTNIVIESHFEKLNTMLREAQAKPFEVSPAVMATIIKGLYSFKPEIAQKNPILFARFIPNISPPMAECDLPQYMAETQEIQQQLLEEGFQRGDQSRKRRNDTEDMQQEGDQAVNQNVGNLPS